MDVKQQVDQKVLDNANMIQNEQYFSQLTNQIIMSSFDKHNIKLTLDLGHKINNQVTEEYLYQFTS